MGKFASFVAFIGALIGAHYLLEMLIGTGSWPRCAGVIAAYALISTFGYMLISNRFDRTNGNDMGIATLVITAFACIVCTLVGTLVVAIVGHGETVTTVAEVILGGLAVENSRSMTT